MSKDFKASQIRTSKIVVSGSSSDTPALLIYSASDATNYSGDYQSSMLDDVGSDVFLFVSGSKNSRTGVSVFGGDVIVSGTLYMENLVAEVDNTTTGDHYVSGNLHVQGPLARIGSDKGAAGKGAGLEVHAGNGMTSFIDLVEKDGTVGNESTFGHAGVYGFRLAYSGASGHNHFSLDRGLGTSKTSVLKSDLGNNKLFVFSGSNSGANSPDMWNSSDVNFFVSGAISSRGTLVRGTSVFGGDVVVSGSLTDAFGEPITGGGSPGVGWFTGSGGNDAPGEGSGWISTTGSLVVSGTDLFIAKNIKHIGDSGTKIEFPDSGNQIKITAGTSNTIFASTTSTVINNNQNDIDTFVKSQNGSRSLFHGVAAQGNEQVLILSGGAKVSPNEANGTDVGFFVSGSVGSKGTSTKGTSVFGGDVYISGTTHVNDVIFSDDAHIGDNLYVSGTLEISKKIQHGGDPDTFIDFNANSVEVYAGSGAAQLKIQKNSTTNQLEFIVNEGYEDIDFDVRSDSSKKHAIFVNSSLGKVGILSGSDSTGLSPDEMASGEVSFFVSGSKNSLGSTSGGVSVFGGDVVHSGSLKIVNVGVNQTGSHVLLHNASVVSGDGGNTRIDVISGYETETLGRGAKLEIAKAGPNNAMATGGPHSTTMRNLSGNIVFRVGNSDDIGGYTGQYGIFLSEAYGTQYLTALGSSAGNSGWVSILSGGAPQSHNEYGYPDVNFFVSGASGHKDGSTRGIALFGGDLVSSGNLYISKSLGPIGNPNSYINFQDGHTNSFKIVAGGTQLLSRDAAGSPDSIVLNADEAAISTLIKTNSKYAIASKHTTNTVYINSDNANEDGSDTSFWISGSIGRREDSAWSHRGTTVFGGDVLFSGSIASEFGISGSLTTLVDGSSYLMAGDNVTITSASNGGITIAAASSGGSVTLSSGSTSVGSTTTLDVGRLGIINNLGGGSVAITGTIGQSEDGTYGDGLFTSFNSDTEIGHAIDKINEVLFYLAPSPAPDLSKIGTGGAAGTTALLSLGSSTGVASSGFTLVAGSAGIGAAVDVNESYTVVTASDNIRMGIFTEYRVFTGSLADGVAANAYVNNVINHSGSAFGNADQGTLKLEINGTVVKTVDLTVSTVGSGNPGSGAGSEVDANSHGFIELSHTGSAVQSNGQEFGLFKYRTGKFQIHTGGGNQRQGWNYAKVVHSIGSTNKVTNQIEWFVDSSGVAPNANDVAINNVILSGSKLISGVQFATGARGEYVSRIDNFYDHVYSQNAITFNVTNTDAIPSQTVPDLPESSGAQYNNSIFLTGSFRVSDSSINNGTMASGSAAFNFSVSHPTKANMSNTGSITTNKFLLYSASQLATGQKEDFVYEDYRLTSGSYDTQGSVAAAGATWNSALHLTSSTTGQGDGLAFYAGKLKSALSTTSNQGNFTIFETGYATGSGHGHHQPNYSTGGASDGIKTFYRYFTNNSGGDIRDFDLIFTGSSTSQRPASTNITDSSSNVQVFAKIPGKTGWLDGASSFVYGAALDYNGGALVPYGGSFNTTIGNSESPVTNHITFGTASVANGEHVVLKIRADAAWAGQVSGMNVVFPAIASDAVTTSPSLDELDISSPGTFYNAKLSFGANKSSGGPAGYFNVTGSASSNGGNGPFGLGTDIDYNVAYSSDTNAGSNKRYGVISSNGTSQLIKGVLNGDVSSSGNSFTADSFGSAHTGSLILYVNQSGSNGSGAVHTLNLANFVGEGLPGSGTGTALNANNSGFISASFGMPGRDSDQLSDYRYIYRTAHFQVGPGDQNSKGWNWAKVVHAGVPGSADRVTTYVEWVNDDDGDAVAVSEYQSGSFGNYAVYYQSGVKYFNTALSPVATGSVMFKVADAYTNVYSNSSTALQLTTLTHVTAAGIFVTGSAITNTGDVSLSSNGTNLPGLTSSGDITSDIHVTGTLTYTGGTSLPGDGSPLNSFQTRTAVATITVDHPIDSNATQAVSIANFLAYSGSSSTSNKNTVEKFTAEQFRLQSGSYATQDASGSAAWSTGQSLVGANPAFNTGLLIYGYDGANGYLVSPKSSALPNAGDFRSFNDLTSPYDNVNYSGASGERHYFRAFKNNTSSDQAVISVLIKGSATLVPRTGAGSASLGSNQNIYAFVKIPGKTGWLDIAKPADGTISDGGGALQGDRDSSIDGSGATNEVTFSTAFVGGDPASDDSGEYFMLAIHADSNWTGNIKEIVVTF